MIKEEIILDTDESAAKLITVTGWTSRTGRFYGDKEDMARYDGCTHKTCDCGKPMAKAWTKCESCRHESAIKRYNAYPFEPWDNNDPVCTYDGETYFFNEEEIEEYSEEHEIEASDLMLVKCHANYLDKITTEYWESVLPEDGEVPVELLLKLDELNKFIATLPAISWSPSKIRTEYKK